MEEEVKEAFINRPGLVEKNATGFKGLNVIRTKENPAEFWLITHRETEKDFHFWHKNHKSESHKGIPKGLKLVKRSFELRYFEHITS